MSKKVLVVSTGLFHPGIRSGRYFKQLLSSLRTFDFQLTRQANDIALLRKQSFQSALLYFNSARVADQVLGNLEDFVFNGGGLLVLNSTATSLAENKRFTQLLGGKAIRGSKAKVCHIKLSTGKPTLFKGFKAVELTEQLPHHHYMADVKIHLIAKAEGIEEPVVWTRELGKGRICYCALGCHAPILKTDLFMKIFERCLTWVCGGKS